MPVTSEIANFDIKFSLFLEHTVSTYCTDCTGGYLLDHILATDIFFRMAKFLFHVLKKAANSAETYNFYQGKLSIKCGKAL